MAITAYKIIQAKNAAALNILIAAEIAASRYPAGNPCIRQVSISPPIFDIRQGSATGGTAIVGWKLLEDVSPEKLLVQITAQIALGYLPAGDIVALPLLDGGYNGLSLTAARFYQVVIKVS